MAEVFVEVSDALDLLVVEFGRHSELARLDPALAADIRRLALRLRERLLLAEVKMLPDPPGGPSQPVQFARQLIWRDQAGGQVALAVDGRLFRRGAIGAPWELVEFACSVEAAAGYVASLPGTWQMGGGVCPQPARASPGCGS